MHPPISIMPSLFTLSMVHPWPSGGILQRESEDQGLSQNGKGDDHMII